MWYLHILSYLFAIVCDWRQDGSQCLKAHSNIEQMGGKEEVVIVTQDGHGHVPGQVEEGLKGGGGGKRLFFSHYCRNCVKGISYYVFIFTKWRACCKHSCCSSETQQEHLPQLVFFCICPFPVYLFYGYIIHHHSWSKKLKVEIQIEKNCTFGCNSALY